MTSSLAAPDTSLPLISNLNSFIAFSLLCSRIGDGNKLEMELSDLGVADTLGSVDANSLILRSLHSLAMTVPIDCGTPAAEWDRSGVSAPQAAARLVGFEPSFP
jgi:hypothetical protein